MARSWEFEPKMRSTAVPVHLSSSVPRSRPSATRGIHIHEEPLACQLQGTGEQVAARRTRVHRGEAIDAQRRQPHGRERPIAGVVWADSVQLPVTIVVQPELVADADGLGVAEEKGCPLIPVSVEPARMQHDGAVPWPDPVLAVAAEHGLHMLCAGHPRAMGLQVVNRQQS